MSFAVATTGAHMGANTNSLAICPHRVRIKTMDGEVHDCGVIFISSDTGHDKHQVISYQSCSHY